ncbi:hypothetical protein Misp02_46470 [Microtetraspora sp. NBRC 16547]|nr:hypothetical protein Misp02_46470 [Microtetraspora sp. NBRC 16547]
MGRLDDIDHGGLGRLMARGAGQRPLCGPPAVPVHDARHMMRQASHTARPKEEDITAPVVRRILKSAQWETMPHLPQ